MAEDRESLIHFIEGIFPMQRAQSLAIVAHFKKKHFNKNDFVLLEDKICNEYYFLDEGFMRAYANDSKGRDVTTAFYSEKQVVCELFSFFKRIPSGENIQALADCKCYYITYDELQLIFHAMPEFREFGRAILINAYAKLKERMLSMVRETAEERYNNLIKSNPAVFQNASLKNISSYLGVTDTSLSRIRKGKSSIKEDVELGRIRQEFVKSEWQF